ncbi:MAG: hypothetical protein DMF56_06210 [Acidobacteria bacterium]|nr:MAG: hypothetical protein DMF56_06210 [Acidobacteriota bacterium]
MRQHQHLEKFEPLNVEYRETFFDAYLRLDVSSETFRALMNLLDKAIKDGEEVRRLSTSKLRVIRTPAGSCLRPMRLYFLVEHRTLHFVHIEYYDEDYP